MAFKDYPECNECPWNKLSHCGCLYGECSDSQSAKESYDLYSSTDGTLDELSLKYEAKNWKE